MIQSSRISDKLIDSSITGPSQRQESQNLNTYVKRVSSDSLKINFNQSQEIKNQDQLFGTGRNRYSISPGRQQLNIYYNQNQMFSKAVKNRILVEKFKNNLFSSAQILKSEQKTLLKNYSNYLIEKLGTSSQRQFLYQNDFTSKLFSIVFVILSIFCKDLNRDKINYEIKQFFIQKKKYFHFWDLFALLINLFTLWYCPFIISFGLNDHLLVGIDILIVIFIFIDSNITRIQRSLEKVENLFENQYRTNECIILLVDFTRTVLQIFIYLEYYKIAILREFIFVSIIAIILYSIKQKYEKQVEMLFLQGINLDFLDLLTLIITILFFTHFISCFWFYIGEITLESYGSWLQIYDIQNTSLFSKYIYSFYWATATVATVGYGDITPKNQIEVGFTTLIMLFSSCMFAYTLNSIGLIVNSMYQQNLKQKRSLALLNKYMKAKQINDQLQIRVRNYLKFSTEKDIIENYEATQNLINSLPNGLKTELKYNEKSNITNKIVLFKNQFSQQTNLQVSNALIRANFTPQDIVYHKNDQNEKYMYFVSSGEVRLIEEQSQTLLGIIKAGQTFGEYQFFTNQTPREAAICSQFTELYKIDRDTFLKILIQNSKDFQRFHKIKDQLLFQKDSTTLKQKCIVCLSQSHFSINCPLSQKIPNLYINILKNNFTLNNQREQYERNYKKFQTLNEHELIILTVAQFQERFDFLQFGSLLELYSLSDTNIKKNQRSLTFDDGTGASQNFISYKSIKNKEQYSLSRMQQSILLEQNNKEGLINQRKKNTTFTQNNHQLDILREKYFSDSIEDFDKLQIYTEYFPHNNITYQLKLAMQKEIKKKKMSFQRNIRLKKGLSTFA